MKRTNIIGILLIAVLAITPRTFAYTVSLDELALWSGNNLGLGNNVVVNAHIAGGGEISTGSGVNLHGVYSEDQIWLGSSAVVRGNVMANKAAEAAGNLDLQGDWVGKSVYFGSNANITGNVINALNKDSHRRINLITTLVPSFLRSAFIQFAGTTGTERYDSFVSGKYEYWAYTLKKNESIK